jgi:hypothetical protein
MSVEAKAGGSAVLGLSVLKTAAGFKFAGPGSSAPVVRLNPR